MSCDIGKPPSDRERAVRVLLSIAEDVNADRPHRISAAEIVLAHGEPPEIEVKPPAIGFEVPDEGFGDEDDDGD